MLLLRLLPSSGVAFLTIVASCLGGLPPRLSAADAPELFAFDNGVGRSAWSGERQAATLRELGYQGITYNYTNPEDMATRLAAIQQAGLRMYGLYAPARLGQEETFAPGLAETVRALRGSGAVLWLIVPKPAQAGNYDAEVVQKIQAAADLAASAGLRVVLYPHKGFFVADVEHAYRLAVTAQRANVGVTFNLCHELAAGNGARLPAILRQVAPLLQMVSLNGATDKPGGTWDDFIQVLGQGQYDVAALLRTLREVNYRGPIGLQFYNVKGDPYANLSHSMIAWRSLNKGIWSSPDR
ncbi:MAG: TIM barrel protein [Verrucomicrobia bacterium]|nr:TIM barrel protein [Verrucomicrobiota bacterium]